MKKIVILALALSLMTVILLAQNSEQNQTNPPRPGQAEQNHRPGHNHNMNQTQQNNPMPPMHMGMHHGQNNGLGIWERLDLNRTQHREISAMVERFRGDMRAKHEAIRTLRDELKDAMMNENFRRARNLNRRINNLRNEISEARLNHHERILNQLNRDQKAQLRRIMQEMRERMQNSRQGRMGRGSMGHDLDCEGMGEGGQGHHNGQGQHGNCTDCQSEQN
ncbi:MAG TPA: hypothetical protein PLX59_01510 [Candidatus Cloacimonadota bacterium]|nr:hypothetical protein [Candidatus Cloacimonadota bacterium]